MHGRPNLSVNRKSEKSLIERSAGADLVWLLGQPHLGDYLDFVKGKAIGGADLSFWVGLVVAGGLYLLMSRGAAAREDLPVLVTTEAVG